jgi:hypothetical protein
MTPFLCLSCGAQFDPSPTPPAVCPLCADERGIGPKPNGPQFATMDEIHRQHKLVTQKIDVGLYGLGITPEVAIGQRALLIRSVAGNILWDCIPFLDATTIEWVKALGGISAIALSHPHFYSAAAEWSQVFQAPVYLHEDDRQWVTRHDADLRFWSGDTQKLQDGIVLVRCGGHYAGGAVLYWPEGAGGKGSILSSDVLQVTPGRPHVSFMRSYPTLLPLPHEAIDHIASMIEPLKFETIHGGWWDLQIGKDAKAVFEASIKRYHQALNSASLSAQDQ